jgi:hypothetical protein
VWGQEPVWTPWNREEFLALAGNQTPAVLPVARRYTDWAIPDPSNIAYKQKRFARSGAEEGRLDTSREKDSIPKRIFLNLENGGAVAEKIYIRQSLDSNHLTITIICQLYCSVQSRCYATTARWADILGPFLGNGSVSTFPLLGSRFLIMQQLDYNS